MRQDGGGFWTIGESEEETMGEISVIGLDLAKQVFHVVGFDARGKKVRKKQLRRAQMLRFFAQCPPCRVGMEACAGAHYWAQELRGLGHTVGLIPAQHVKAYVRGNKNDYNDARAIAEALSHPGMRQVAVKTVEQQALQGEYGIMIPQGLAVLRRRLPELLEEADNGLSALLRRLLAQKYRRLQEVDADIDSYTREVHRQVRASEPCRRLQVLPGYGPILASAFHG
jgi:transposase